MANVVYTFFTIALILDIITEHRVGAYSLTDVKKLKKLLLNDTEYDRKIRPTLDQTKPTEVSFHYQHLFYSNQILIIVWLQRVRLGP